MKELSLAILMGSLLAAPAPSYAHHWWRHGPVVRYHTDGAAIAAGVLGGVATGIVLDRILISPPPRVHEPVYTPPVYSPPPPRDPYDAGYSEGYSQGAARGRYERYEQGKRRGYQDGYDDTRDGGTSYR